MVTHIELALICVFALFAVLALSSLGCAVSSDPGSCEISPGTIAFLQLALAALGLILCMNVRR